MNERDLQVRAAKGMAGQLEESPTVTKLREKIAEQEKEIESLRHLCGALYAGPALYLDDGEIQDNRDTPFIDFLRDPPEEIRQKIITRAQNKATKN